MPSSSARPSNRCDTQNSVLRPPAPVCDERYLALMRHTRQMHILLASLLLAASASAQTADSQATPSGASEVDGIAMARSQYAETADIARDSNAKTILAQFQRRGPGAPIPPRRAYPRRESYGTTWAGYGDARHVAIGAAIGFGVGATFGAIGSIRNRGSVGDGILLGGSLCGLFGAAIGASHAGYSSFARHRKMHQQSRQEDEEADRGLDSSEL